MGKVLKAIAIIAVSAALAYFAPTIGLSFLHAFGSAAVAGSLAATAASFAVAAVLSAGVGLIFSAFASAPHTTASPGLQQTRAQPIERIGINLIPPAPPSITTLSAIMEPWWKDALFYPWQRYTIVVVTGSCMKPIVPAGVSYVLIDRRAPITAGQLFLVCPTDLRQYLTSGGHDKRASGLLKRFIGFDPERKVIVFETTNPPCRIESGISRIKHAYPVLGSYSSRRHARAALRSYRRG